MIAVPLSVLNTRASDDLKPTHHMYYGQRIVECAGDGLPKFLKSKGELWTPESDAMTVSYTHLTLPTILRV